MPFTAQRNKELAHTHLQPLFHFQQTKSEGRIYLSISERFRERGEILRFVSLTQLALLLHDLAFSFWSHELESQDRNYEKQNVLLNHRFLIFLHPGFLTHSCIVRYSFSASEYTYLKRTRMRLSLQQLLPSSSNIWFDLGGKRIMEKHLPVPPTRYLNEQGGQIVSISLFSSD